MFLSDEVGWADEVLVQFYLFGSSFATGFRTAYYQLVFK